MLFAVIIGIPGVGRLLFDFTDSLFGAIGGDAAFADLGRAVFMFWR